MTKKIDALLLSAGKSSRMGFTKALVDWHNQKLIQFQIETLLNSGCTKVFIVLGHEKEKIIPYIQNKKNTKIIYNENYKTGKSSSIIKGINNISKNTNNLLIIGVDQPRPIKFLKKLLHFHLKNNAMISAPLNNNKRGHPIIFNEKMFPEILKIDKFDDGLRTFFRKNNKIVQTIKINSKWTHLDLNSTESLDKARGLKLI
ncbi:MAG: hypothetical protein CL775_03295 [Chloroflexi bacterium]|nr:hypothetical protein [Chloroflexota bacterium]